MKLKTHLFNSMDTFNEYNTIENTFPKILLGKEVSCSLFANNQISFDQIESIRKKDIDSFGKNIVHIIYNSHYEYEDDSDIYDKIYVSGFLIKKQNLSENKKNLLLKIRNFNTNLSTLNHIEKRNIKNLLLNEFVLIDDNENLSINPLIINYFEYILLP